VPSYCLRLAVARCMCLRARGSCTAFAHRGGSSSDSDSSGSGGSAGLQFDPHGLTPRPPNAIPNLTSVPAYSWHAIKSRFAPLQPRRRLVLRSTGSPELRSTLRGAQDVDSLDFISSRVQEIKWTRGKLSARVFVLALRC